MKVKTFSVCTINELIASQHNKTSQLRNPTHQSYHEHQHHCLQNLPNDLLSTLLKIAHKTDKQDSSSALFTNFLNNSANVSSILAFADQIPPLLRQCQTVTVSHKHFQSQSLLLALYLSKQYNSKVELVMIDNQLKGVAHLISEPSQADRLGFTKESAAKEGVNIHNLSEWELQDWINSNSIVLLDLFGLNPIEYRPFLLGHLQKLSKAKQIVFYHSHLQDEEVTEQLKIAGRIQGTIAFQVWPQYPLQVICEKDEKAMLERLSSFLREDSQRPQKQDVVIFYPPSIHIRKFSGKLAEHLSKQHLKDQTCIITKPFQTQPAAKNCIFLVQSASQLYQWDYDYSQLFYALDYKEESSFYYDYQLETYVQKVGASTGVETAQRMAFVNSIRIGRYASLPVQNSQNFNYLNTIPELSSYLIKMIAMGAEKSLETSHPRLLACLRAMEQLGIIEKGEESLKIVNEKVLQVAKEGISGIEAKLVLDLMEDGELSESQRAKLSNLLVMCLVVMHNAGNLRQGKQQIESAAHIKPNGIWRKSGYLQSCLQILTKYELIEQRKKHQNSHSESFRRKTSKVNDYEYDVFGSLFQIIEPKKKGFEDMQEEDFLRDCTLNEELLLHVRQEIEDFREAIGLERTSIIFETQDLYALIKKYLVKHPKPVAIYSGSRREGYNLPNLPSIFPDKKSLMSQLNERPECVFVMRLSFCENRYEILMGNGFNSEVFLQIFGRLPGRRSESHGEMEVEFHGISNSTFEELWKNNGETIVRFETENQCFVQPNQEMALIMIHCRREASDKIKGLFEAMLGKIREKVSLSNKLMHYLGNTNVLLGSGGAVQEIIQTNYIDKCVLGNLHLDVTEEDLEQLFQDLFVLKKIELQPPETGKFFKSAIISFLSQRDYYKFKECFNEILYFDRLMEVKPLREESQHLAVKNKQYIQFKWFVWRSHRKALVRFANNEQALKAFSSLKQYPQLDGAEVVATCQEREVILQNLNSHTDEICIEEAMKGFGEVKEVQILKTPLKEVSGNDLYLETLIKDTFVNQNNQQPPQFKMEPIEKSKNGLRICRVHMTDLNAMNRVAAELNKSIAKLGEARLYAQTWFETPVMVPHGSMGIYQSILAEVLGEVKVTNIATSILQDGQKTYMVLKSPIKQTLDTFHQRLMGSLKGYVVNLSDYQKTVILSEIGLANLLDLEEKYHCKLIVDEIHRTLSTLVASQSRKALHEQIKARVEDHFFYRVSLNRKSFKHFKSNPEKLKEIQSTYFLRLTEIQADSTALLLEGSALNVQKAFNYLMHLMESLAKVDEELINADVCGICCSEPHRPYRLQACCHKFCRNCLLDYISTVLGDNAMFPIKCPHCFAEVVIDDLDSILDPTQWAKVLTMATNQYLAKHGEVMTFCFTAGCKQINMIKGDHIECDVCLSTYCLECKGRYHPGMTCQQAREGGDEAFKKYMKENGIRQCPNEKCKIPVIRIDGCYRVTCSRCNKSMCFKCEADKMIAYDNYNDCYKHLNDVHGGYW